jgi:hypothetical protein
MVWQSVNQFESRGRSLCLPGSHGFQPVETAATLLYGTTLKGATNVDAPLVDPFRVRICSYDSGSMG